MLIQKKQAIAIILFVAAFVFGIIGFSLIVKGDNQIYTINSDYFAASNKNDIKFFKYNDLLIFASSNSNNTKVTSFNPQTGELNLVYDGDCKSVDIQSNNLFLAYNSYKTDDEYNLVDTVRVEKYDISLALELENPTETIIENASIKDFNSFAVDVNGNYLLLNNKNSYNKIIEFYSSDGNKNTDLECSFNLNYIFKSLEGQVFASSANNDAFISLATTSATEYHDVNLPINIIDTETFIDSESNVYSLTDSIEYLYSTATGNNIACDYADNILVYCDNGLLLLDKTSGQALSQFQLNQVPSIIIENNKIISCFNLSELNDNKITIEVINSTPDKLQYQNFVFNDNVFICNPSPGSYTSDELSNYDDWTVSFDQQKLLVGIREVPSIKITSSGSEIIMSDNDYTINDDNSLTFSSPENISEGTYSVTITGLCTNTGRPAICNYSINVKDETTTSSTTSSETTSTTSSTESTEESKPYITKIESSVYTIDRTNNTIRGVTPGTTLAQLKKNITYSGTIYAVKNNGSIIKSGKVGTGTKIYLMNSDTELDCLTVIVDGDLTGEGNVNSNDIQQGCNYLLGEDNLDEFSLLAFDLNNDGDIDPADLVLLKRLASNIAKK